MTKNVHKTNLIFKSQFKALYVLEITSDILSLEQSFNFKKRGVKKKKYGRKKNNEQGLLYIVRSQILWQTIYYFCKHYPGGFETRFHGDRTRSHTSAYHIRGVLYAPQTSSIVLHFRPTIIQSLLDIVE